MARRRKTKSKTKVKLFNFGGSGKKRAKTSRQPLNLKYAFRILALAAVFACIWFGFLFLDKYVKTAIRLEEKQGSLYLVDVPLWVNEPLKVKIYNAARADGEDLKLDADAAWSIQQNIKDLVAWLEEVKVQTTSDRFLIKAKWRKPLALVKYGLHKYYVDANLVLLDFVPALNLAVAKVTGLKFKTKPPYAGEIWQLEDLDAAIRILTKLEQMDKALTPDKPLLNDIDKSLSALQKAVACGYSDLKFLELDDDLINLRKDKRFKKFISTAKGKLKSLRGAQVTKQSQL